MPVVEFLLLILIAVLGPLFAGAFALSLAGLGVLVSAVLLAFMITGANAIAAGLAARLRWPAAWWPR